MPMVDVLDEGDRFVVAVELPGVRKEDIRLNVHDNVVRIHAERTESVEAPGEGGVGERAERGLRGQGSGRAAGRAGGASVEPRGGEGRGGYVRRERIQMAFDRTIRLPEEIRDDQVTARFTNGVLTLVLPKADPQGGGGNIRIE
jgi:HSP20 family protein